MTRRATILALLSAFPVSLLLMIGFLYFDRRPLESSVFLDVAHPEQSVPHISGGLQTLDYVLAGTVLVSAAAFIVGLVLLFGRFLKRWYESTPTI